MYYDKKISIKILDGLCITCFFCAAQNVRATDAGNCAGEFNASLAYSRSAYVTKSNAADGEFTYQGDHYKLAGEFNGWQEAVRTSDSLQSRSSKYDLIGKYIRPIHDIANYFYFSPRFRGSTTGFFESSKALRLGLGREFFSDPNLSLSLEAGIGYRQAQLVSDETIDEQLSSFSTKLRWSPTPALVIKATFSHEQSDKEKYRTSEFSIKKNLIGNIGLRYSLTYRQTFPYDSLEPNGEMRTNVSLNYTFSGVL